MDRVSELLEQIAIISNELSQTITDEVKDDIDRGLLLTEVNALDYDIHEIRKHLERINREQITE